MAANGGNPDAQHELGRMYFAGHGALRIMLRRTFGSMLQQPAV
jgi:TPR repeat protein